MAITALIYDGSFEGLLCAVFEVYTHRLQGVKLHIGDQHSSAMFEDVLKVITDEKRAARVLKGLRERLSPIGVQRLYAAHLAGIAGEDLNLMGYMRYVFDTEVNIEEDYGNRYVMRVSELVRMIRREKHRMEAFVRFQQLSDGTYYAAIEPDFDVLPLLIRHFKSRYADQRWMIYDIKRKYGLYYDLHDTQFIEMDFADAGKPGNIVAAFSAEESAYQHLWKNYFNSVNLASRKNTRLHVRHIPKRYWKHLTEKI